MTDQSPGIAARLRANIRLTSKQQSGFPMGPRTTHPFSVRLHREFPDDDADPATIQGRDAAGRLADRPDRATVAGARRLRAGASREHAGGSRGECT